MALNLLLEHEKTYIESRKGRSIELPKYILKIGMVNGALVKGHFVYGSFNAAKKAKEGNEFLIDPSITPVGNKKYRLTWI